MPRDASRPLVRAGAGVAGFTPSATFERVEVRGTSVGPGSSGAHPQFSPGAPPRPGRAPRALGGASSPRRVFVRTPGPTSDDAGRGFFSRRGLGKMAVDMRRGRVAPLESSRAALRAVSPTRSGAVEAAGADRDPRRRHGRPLRPQHHDRTARRAQPCAGRHEAAPRRPPHDRRALALTSTSFARAGRRSSISVCTSRPRRHLHRTDSSTSESREEGLGGP